jgi:hypothetical protein
LDEGLGYREALDEAHVGVGGHVISMTTLGGDVRRSESPDTL